MAGIRPGAVPSPNIWNSPQVYELENRAVDPDGVIETEMRAIRGWQAASILDVGCGTGFHLPRFAVSAARVVGVEPHGRLADRARQRTRHLTHVSVRDGAAQALPVPDASVDIAHARWAYFFGPGSEPGLAELARVIRRGGVAFIIDNDPTESTFGRWFSAAHPDYEPRVVDEFFSRQGWTTLRRHIRWRFETRAAFEQVVGIEFAPLQVERILAEHSGTEVDYAIVIRVRHY